MIIVAGWGCCIGREGKALRENECRLSLRERTFFRRAKDSHMGVGWTGFNQPECARCSLTPPVMAFCLLFAGATAIGKEPPLPL